MKKYLNLLPLLFATGLLAQDELPDLRVQNPGGTVQELFEVKLLRVEPDGLRVLHSAGAAKVPYELLPEALQAKYGFNADQAQEHRQSVTIQIAATRQQETSPVMVPAMPPPTNAPGTLWAATPGSTTNLSTNWTGAAELVMNSNAFAGDSTASGNSSTSTSTSTTSRNNPANYASTPSRYGTGPSNFTYRSSGSLSTYRSPTVARVSSYRRSSRSTRYYGYSSNCHPYSSPIYYTSVPRVSSSRLARSASSLSTGSMSMTATNRPVCAYPISMR